MEGQSRVRIIPARAGFTRDDRGRPRYPRDHPRSRGVYTRTCTIGRQRGGSSPLARGLPYIIWTGAHEPGIIPARAGFTGHDRCVARDHGDHPRSRGVYGYVWEEDGSVLGSSPLARGLHPLCRKVLARQGIIPARAGFTAGPVAPVRVLWDHPRSRGVYAEDLDVVECVWGSSPLARGLRGAQRRF